MTVAVRTWDLPFRGWNTLLCLPVRYVPRHPAHALRVLFVAFPKIVLSNHVDLYSRASGTRGGPENP